MTLPASGAISLGDIQTEFGGSDPASLDEYYRGGTYVPNIAYTQNIPTSGTIAMSNFYSQGARGTAVQAASYFWTNRSNYLRTSFATTSYPGDNAAWHTGSPDRFASSGSTSFTFNGSGTAESSVATVLSWTAGPTTAITANTTTPSAASTLYSITFGGMGVRTLLVNALNTAVTADALTWSRTSNRDGSIQGGIVLPGNYAVTSNAQNPAANSGTDYVRTLAAGEIMFVISNSNYDYNEQVYPTLGSGLNAIYGTYWWYTDSVYQVIVNNSSSSANVTWDTNAGGFLGSNRMFILLTRSS